MPPPNTLTTRSSRAGGSCRSKRGRSIPACGWPCRGRTRRPKRRSISPLREAHPDLEIVEQGSSYKFCLLAEGKVDYYVRTTHTYEWDTAAGELILAEAGGRTRTLPDDRELLYNEEDLRNPWFVCRSKHCKI